MGLLGGLRHYFRELWHAWNRFWFTPVDPATLSFIRLLAGGMLFYTHLVWSLDLTGFIGPEGYTPVSLLNALEAPIREWSQWSLFYWIKPTWLLWMVHIFALLIFLMLFVGLFSRVTSVLGFLLAVSYANRVTPGAFFGLDKTNCMLAMYLMLGPCGARYSIDSLWRLHRGDRSEPPDSTSANLALRLLQIHLCIVYLFSGIAKMEGTTWRLGTALWWSAANYEYQSIDLTWLGNWPLLMALLTHVTVFWEMYYCALVWNRFTRPIALWLAVFIHGGIALFMGMMTFGLAMIFANLAFLKPETIRRWVDPVANRVSLAITGKKVG
jgi:hypothetical protein